MAVRNREATEARIVDAFGRVLEEKGIEGVTVNAVVKEARIGKDLIYRYFGGLPGVAEAWGSQSDFLPAPHELLQEDIDQFMAKPVAERLQVLLVNYLRQLRKRPVLLEVLACELLQQNPVTQALAKARRERAFQVRKLYMDENEAAEIDFEALFVVLVGSLHYLAMRESKNPPFLDLNLRETSHWERIEAAVERIVRLYLGSA